MNLYEPIFRLCCIVFISCACAWLAMGRLHADTKMKKQQCPPLFADLVGAVVDDGYATCFGASESMKVWAIGHPCGLPKCVVVAENLHGPFVAVALARHEMVRGMSGALVFMASRNTYKNTGIPLGIGREMGEGNFGVSVCGILSGSTLCCPKKNSIQGMVVMAVYPRGCIRFFPELAPGCVGIVDQEKSKSWVVFASMAHAVRARAVLSKAHCRLSRCCPWAPEVVGTINFHGRIVPVVFEHPVETEVLPGASTIGSAYQALMGVTPKGCARRFCHFPGFIGLVTGRHAEDSIQCRDWMLFESFAAAGSARNAVLPEEFWMSLPRPIAGWIGHSSGIGYSDGYIVSRVVDLDYKLLWTACVYRSTLSFVKW